MKRNIYIISFAALGILLGFVLHGVVEILVIKALVSDWEKYGLGFTFNQWMTIHWVFLAALVLLGALGGFKAGKHWWQILYVEQKYGKPRF